MSRPRENNDRGRGREPTELLIYRGALSGPILSGVQRVSARYN